MATEWDMWKLCTSVCAKPEVGISPHSVCGGPWVNVYNSVRRISRWRRKCSSVCIDFCFHLGKTGAETYKMLQAAFRESCLSRSKTFEWYSRFKGWTPILSKRPQPRQAFHLPHRGDRGTCAKNQSC